MSTTIGLRPALMKRGTLVGRGAETVMAAVTLAFHGLTTVEFVKVLLILRFMLFMVDMPLMSQSFPAKFEVIWLVADERRVEMLPI